MNYYRRGATGDVRGHRVGGHFLHRGPRGDGARLQPERPLAAFVGHRTAGQLRVERERNDHPGVCRGVGLFGPDVLPENCRDREQLLGLLADEDDG